MPIPIGASDSLSWLLKSMVKRGMRVPSLHGLEQGGTLFAQTAQLTLRPHIGGTSRVLSNSITSASVGQRPNLW